MGRALPKYLDEEEVLALLNVIKKTQGADGARLRALLELLYAAGLRVSELVGLPLGAVSFDRGAVQVQGKGGKERTVPLGDPAILAVKEWLPWRKESLGEKRKSSFLFPSFSSKTGYITRQRFFQMLKAIGLQAGIDPKRLSPHVLRHALRHASDRTWRGFAQRTNDARARRYCHDANLHARRSRSSGANRRRAPSFGRKEKRKEKNVMLFIRHGQSTFNVAFDATGQDPQTPDAPLSPRGVKQVEAAIKGLKDQKIGAIISSPYTRALQTASIIASGIGATIHVEPLVGERRLYRCDIGSPVFSLRRDWPRLDFAAVPDGEWWLPFHESMKDVERRVSTFHAKWQCGESDAQMLVVSHWYFIYASTGLGLDNAEVAALT